MIALIISSSNVDARQLEDSTSILDACMTLAELFLSFFPQFKTSTVVAGVQNPRWLRGAGHSQRPGQNIHRQQQYARALPEGECILQQHRSGEVLREEGPPLGLRGLRERTV